MNRVNSRSDHRHEDSTVDIVIELLLRATNALRAIVARQSTRQFTQSDTHNQNVCIVTMRAGDG